jgi:primary-amine oxidase
MRIWTLGLALAPLAAGAADHPLDALGAEELSRAVEILTEAGHADADARFPALTLMEPDKAEVLDWTEGAAMPARRAFAAIRRGPETFEAVVDLAAGAVESHRQVEGVESGILLEEWKLAYTATVQDERWQEAMRARGYESFDELFCAPLSTGFFGEDQPHAGARILKVPCFDTTGAENNLWGKPIEGLLTVVDLNEGRVIDVIDTGVVPVPADAPLYGEGEGQRAALRPVEMDAPAGANYRIEGGEVSWQNWSFHLRFDRRVGSVVSLVAFDDGEGPRSIAYQIALSEMFVPYMDADPGWHFRSYMDIGEYGFGLLASELRAGVDCPGHATFLEATIADDLGAPITMPNVVCVFERPTGDPLWRHAELIDGTYEGRPEVELVVRTIPTVGNYDYVVECAPGGGQIG